MNAITLLMICILAGVGAFHIVNDTRSFHKIEEQCEQQGFIQNKITRIKCEVEK